MTTTFTVEDTWVHWFAKRCHCRREGDQRIVSRNTVTAYWALIVQTAWFGLVEVS